MTGTYRQKEWNTDQLLLPWILLLLLKSECCFAHINVSSRSVCFRICLCAITFFNAFLLLFTSYKYNYAINLFCPTFFCAARFVVWCCSLYSSLCIHEKCITVLGRSNIEQIGTSSETEFCLFFMSTLKKWKRNIQFSASCLQKNRLYLTPNQ